MNEIICRLNTEDTFSKNDAESTVDLFSKKQYRYTFWDDNKRKLYQCGIFKNAAMDLLHISLMVYYVDRKILRKQTDDAWTRKVKIYMPVIEIDKWNENRELLEKMLSFLSGDRWSFEFRKRELNQKETKAFKGIIRQKTTYKPNAICMLSGGLDSFIGAIDTLAEDKDVWFVGHYGGGKGVIKYQKNVIDKLMTHYKLSDNQFFNFFASPLQGLEDTTRTRSFMFFAHAIILGSAFQDEMPLIIPENGLISLNIPLTNTRLGSCSTRTTHPYYMRLLQQLLNNLGIKVKLHNPYQFQTKGQMIADCKDFNFLKANISETMSCSHPDVGRYAHETKPSHCGNCLPCVIRRAAIEFAFQADTSRYRDKDFRGISASENLRSYKAGLLDYEKNPIDVSLAIQTSGQIVDNIDNYCTVYKNGIDELKTLLDKYNG
jgi:7-cyano-7-deazaguanine synthase in queuosine biosynthesis